MLPATCTQMLQDKFITKELKLLGDKAARQLLRQCAKIKELSSDSNGAELVRLELDLLKFCGGLPLAIIAAGGSLSGEPKSIGLWKASGVELKLC